MKINKYLAYSLLLAGGLLASCDDYENSIEDYPLNYDIPSVAPNPNIPVGAYIIDPSGATNDVTVWGRLTDPFNDGPLSQGGGKVGPYIKPTLGQYRFYLADTATATIFKSIVRWAKQGGIDFLITPVRPHRWNAYPRDLNSGDTLMIGLISGRFDTLGYVNRGDIKYALSYDFGNIASLGPVNLDYNNLLETVAPEYANPASPYNVVTIPDPTQTAAGYVALSRETRLYQTFRNVSKYFADPTYQTTADGRPILFLENAHQLYTPRSKEVYDNIRDTIFKYSGKHVFLIARQQRWTPTARFEHFFVKGEVDAITPNRLTDAENWNRVYMLNVLINEHIKANKDYLSRSGHNIDYIPSVSPAFHGYVDNGNRNSPIVAFKENEFRERCNIAKLNQGRTPMIIVDSFNDWKRGTQVEPADPDYGNGYGTLYLDILREELKGN